MAEYVYGESTPAEEPAVNEQSASEEVRRVYLDAPASDAPVAEPAPVPSFATPVPPVPPKKEKKPHRGALVSCLAVVCVCTVILSGIAGYFGAAWAAGNAPEVSTPEPDVQYVVVNRSVNTEVAETATGASVTAVAAAVTPSVVEITTSETVRVGYMQGVSTGAGSGVIVSEDGYIITCNHVIASSTGSGYVSQITVTLTDGSTYEAKIIGGDEDSDVALIKIEATGLTPAVLASVKPQVGNTVIAVGNPLGELGGSVTSGIVSALDREITVEDTTMTLMQTDAAINPGNSGGGLFNLNGELVGIVNAKYSSSGIEGLGFSIPVDKAWTVAQQLLEYGYVRGKVVIGVVFQYGRDSSSIYVYSVGDVNKDKLKSGDRVIAVNGIEITEYAQIKEAVTGSAIGDVLTFTVSRSNGKKSEIITVDVTCYEYVPSTAQPITGN